MTERTYPAVYTHPDPLEWDDAWGELTIQALFAQNARRQPDLPALIQMDTTITYGDLETGSNRLAHALLERLKPDQKAVALMFGNNIEMAYAMLAALKAGVLYTPLEPSFSSEQLDAILESVGVSLILCDAQHAAQAESLGRPILPIEDLLHDESLHDRPPNVSVSNQDRAMVLFTSGSTGAPKGVPRVHSQIVAYPAREIKLGRVGRGDRASGFMNHNFTAGQVSILTSLLNGISYYEFDLENEGIANWADWVAEHRITSLFIGSTLFRTLTAHIPADADFSSVRLVSLGAEKTYASDFELFKKYFPPSAMLRSGFGASEAGWVASLFLRHEDVIQGDMVPGGYAHPGVNIFVMDENGIVQPPKTEGELVVRSPNISTAYWDNSAVSRQKFVPDPDNPGGIVYRTGDVGRVEPDGLIYIIGRVDRQVKIRGMNVNTDDVTQALVSHPAVRDAAVLGQPDAQRVMRLVGYLVPESAPPQISDLHAHLAARVAAYMVPSYFLFVDEIPRLASGKPDLKALPPFAGQRPALANDYRAPRTPLEGALARIWEDVLGVRPVGVEDRFLELGGDSLQAARVFVSIEKELGHILPPALLYAAPTVTALAASLETNANDPDADGLYLLPIQTGQRAKPFLYFITPLRGDAMAYQQIIAQLSPDLTIFGLNSWTMSNRQLMRMTIPEMAEAYVKKILQVDPDGPYVMGGHSFAGLLAYEMAHQLRQAGKPVSLVWMGDTFGPGHDPARRLFRGGRRLRREVAAMKPAERAQFWLNRALHPGTYWRRVRYILSDRLGLTAFAPNPMEMSGPEFKGKYTPPAQDVPVVVFRAAQTHAPRTGDESMGWDLVVPGGVCVEHIEGNHNTILRDRGAEQIASVLTRELERRA